MTARVLVAVGIAGAVVASGAPLGGLLVCVALGVVAGVLPDSPAPAVATMAVLGAWAAWGHGLSSPLVVVGAAGLVLAHVAAHLASLGPSDLRVERATLVRWSSRGAVLIALAAGAWGCLALASHRTPSAAWVVGVLAALLAGAATLVATRSSGAS